MPTKVSPNFIELKKADLVGLQSDKATKVPIRGQLVLQENVRTIKLADGRRVYKCKDCLYASKKSTSISPHRKVHSKKTAAVVTTRKKAATRRITSPATVPAVLTVPSPSLADSQSPDGTPVISSLQAFVDASNTLETQLRNRIAELETALNVIRQTAATA